MNPLGTAGPDGFPAHFYQSHWPIIHKDVCYFVLNVLNNQETLDLVNSTYITFIPKVKNASKVGGFQPISLCNIIYKIFAKVLTNRLKSIIPSIISPTQCTFVPSRLITDNLIIAYEALHYMKIRCKGGIKDIWLLS